MTDPHKPIETVFNAAKALAPNDRKAFLDLACKGDAALRQQVERLLAAASAADGFFETQPAGSDDSGITLADTTVREGPGTVIGRYKLLQQIGEGGMGVVYMAEQTESVVRKVALKIIKLGMDTKAVVARFEAERQALALMDHPNIAKVLDAGATDTGRPYFVMELVRGIPITEYCDKNHLSARQRLELFIPVCQAIQHAHQKGIIHRDIKPSNVLVTLHDSQPLPMVIDFGIAKATNQKLTEKTLFTNFAQVIGTPAYMSPEQAEMTKLDVDTRTDIYSLGVLLYELLTGTTPFTAKELMEAGYAGMQRIIAEQDPPRPSTRLSTMQQNQQTTVAANRRMELPALTRLFRGDLDWIVMKCLEKDRARRYETASGLAADLQRHLHTEPVVARPPTAAYRLQKAIRRNRVAFAAAAAVILALVLGLGVATWQAFRASRAEELQVTLRQAAESARTTAELAGNQEIQQRRRAQASEEAAQRLLYAANMNLIQAAWEQTNVARVHQLLKETAASPYRAFEWYYWQSQTHREALRLRGHSGPIQALAYSPDGRRILTGSADGTAKIWDAGSGQALLTLHTPSRGVTAVAFSQDGRRVVTGGEPSSAEVLAAIAGAGQSVPARMNALTRNLPPTPVKVWDAQTGKEILTLPGDVCGTSSVAFSPDNRRILTAGGLPSIQQLGSDGTAILWDATTGKELIRFSGHGSRLMGAVFSPNGDRVATASTDGKARIWEASTGRELLDISDNPRFVTSIAYSPDGGRLITSGDESAKVWNSANGTLLFTLRGHSRWTYVAQYSPNGKRIATGAHDSTVMIWDAANGAHLQTLMGHLSTVTHLAFSPDSHRLATVCADPNVKDFVVRIWNLPDDDTTPTLHEEADRYSQIEFSEDGRRFLTANSDGNITVWDTTSGKRLNALAGPLAPRIDASSGGKWIICGDANGEDRILDAMTGEELNLNGLETNKISATLSSTGEFLCTTRSNNGFVQIWNVTTGKATSSFFVRPEDESISSISPDGRRLLCRRWLSDPNIVTILDASTGKTLTTLRGHEGQVWSAKFSKDGQRIVTSSGDRTVRLWTASTGQELLVFRGHSQAVRSAALSASLSRIVSVSLDGTVKLWDATNGKELLTLRVSGEQVDAAWKVGFAPDASRIFVGLISSTEEDQLKLPATSWDCAAPEDVARWQREENEDRDRLAASKPEGTVTADGISHGQ